LYQLIKEVLEEIKSSPKKTEPKPVVETQPSISKPVVPVRDIYGEKVEETTLPKFEEQPKIIEIEQPPVVIQDHTYTAPVNQTYQTPIYTPPAAEVEEVEDELTLKLKKLKNLYDKQLISQAEYENKKAEILAQL
jgi:hypothetical protein